MKNKRLIIILSILAFITVLVVINSTIFTLHNVSLNWLTTKCELQTLKDYEIIDTVGSGGSIFLLNKDDISEKLEKNYPYLRVVSIETVFPNKIVIHSAERESLFAIKISGDEYAVIDEMGKVLKLARSNIFGGSETDLGAKPIRVDFTNLSLSNQDFVVGKTIDIDMIVDIISNLSNTLRESGYTPTTSKGVFKSIEVVAHGNSLDIDFVTRNGMILSVEKAEDFMTDKLLLAIQLYNTKHLDGVVNGEIKVWRNVSDNKIYAEYIAG